MSERMGVFNPREDEPVNAIPQRAWDGMAPTDPDDVYGKMEMRMNRHVERKPRRPAWAAAPNFPNCWASVETMMQNEKLVEGGKDMLAALSRARVISIDADQVASLPRGEGDHFSYRDLGERLLAANAPFDSVFIDCGGVAIGRGRATSATINLLGATVVMADSVDGSATDGVAIFPFLKEARMPANMSFPWVGWYGSDAGAVEFDTGLSKFGEFGEEQRKFERLHSALAAEMTLAVLDWLQSVNVEIVETELSRAEQRRAERKGRKVALTVRVKQSKRRLSTDSNGQANYSHRFETRGHYKHHFETKPNGEPNKVFAKYADLHPNKVLNIQGQPCVRFWTPPYVKGPIDKPFVPKVRVMETA